MANPYRCTTSCMSTELLPRTPATTTLVANLPITSQDAHETTFAIFLLCYFNLGQETMAAVESTISLMRSFCNAHLDGNINIYIMTIILIPLSDRFSSSHAKFGKGLPCVEPL